MTNELAWIVRAQWSNSGDTFHGPWQFSEQATRWAQDVLDDERGCTFWDVAILQPSTSDARATDGRAD